MTTLAECEAYLKTKLRKPKHLDAMYGVLLPDIPYTRLDGQIFVNTTHKDPSNYSRHSHENHLRFGYGKTPLFGLPELPFSEVVGTPTPDRGTWAQENILNAIRIKEKYGDIALCLSGGLDSELMVAFFLDAGVDFVPYFMIYRGVYGEVLNDYDYHYATTFCDTHGLTLVTDDVYVVEDLIWNRHLDFYMNDVEETKFLLPTLYTQQLAVITLNNRGLMPIFGSDQVEIKMDVHGKPAIGESLFSLGLACPTWAHFGGHDVMYDFFMYSPNSVYSYFDIPEVRNTTFVGDEFKADIAHAYGSKRLGPRRKKATGYEKIKDEMARVGYDLHAITMANIDRVDWTKRPSTQYIHSLDHVLEHSAYSEWQIIRTTTNDFFCRGFDQGDPAYYDL